MDFCTIPSLRGDPAGRCRRDDCRFCRRYESDVSFRQAMDERWARVSGQPPPADPPCDLGEGGWCDRHGEVHPEDTEAHRRSQDPGPDGVRFRLVRDQMKRRRDAENDSSAASPFGPALPGQAVAEMLRRRKIVQRPGCPCKAIMREMDEAGVEGCRGRVAEFADKMRKSAAFMSYEERLAATVNVAVIPVVKSLWAKVRGRPSEEKPFFSFASLILEACDLAERSAQAARDDAAGKLVEAVRQVRHDAPPRPHLAPLRWAVGLTAVPSRRHDLLPQTLKSLEKAGFSGEFAPRLFVDGDRGPWDEFPNEATFRWPGFARGGKPCPWANWWLAAQELFMRQPDADRYALFQDDVVAVRNLRRYLEVIPFPPKGYLNLFAFMNNELLARPGAGPPGWVEAALLPAPSGMAAGSAAAAAFAAERLQCGRGALALVFDREGLVELLRHKDAVERPLEHPAGRGLARIDGGVVDTMNKLGRREWVHRPSLVQHLGRESTVSSRPNPTTKQMEPRRWRLEALTFPGEEFDAMEFLPKEVSA